MGMTFKEFLVEGRLRQHRMAMAAFKKRIAQVLKVSADSITSYRTLSSMGPNDHWILMWHLNAEQVSDIKFLSSMFEKVVRREAPAFFTKWEIEPVRISGADASVNFEIDTEAPVNTQP